MIERTIEDLNREYDEKYRKIGVWRQNKILKVLSVSTSIKDADFLEVIEEFYEKITDLEDWFESERKTLH